MSHSNPFKNPFKGNNKSDDSDSDDAQHGAAPVPHSTRRHFAAPDPGSVKKSGPGTLPPIEGATSRQHHPASTSSLDSSLVDNRYINVEITKLPPGFVEADVRGLIPEHLHKFIIRINSVGPNDEGGNPALSQLALGRPRDWTGRGRAISFAVIQLSTDASLDEVDHWIKKHHHSYLAKGLYISVVRLLPNDRVNEKTQMNDERCFGATKVIPQGDEGRSFHHANASSLQRKEYFAVQVKTPTNAATLNLIQKVAEEVILCGFEDLEATLMSQPEIQENEQFKFLWDSRSDEGVYYRWCLWNILSGHSRVPFDRQKTNRVHQIFKGLEPWIAPEPLPFEFSPVPIVPEKLPNGKIVVHGEGRDYMACMHEYMIDLPNTKLPRELRFEYLNKMEAQHLIKELATLPFDDPDDLRYWQINMVTKFAFRHDTQYKEVTRLLIDNILEPMTLASVARLIKYYHGSFPPPPAATKLGKVENKRKEKAVATMDRPPADHQHIPNAKVVGLKMLAMVLATTKEESGETNNAHRYRKEIGVELLRRQVFVNLREVPIKYDLGHTRAGRFRDQIYEIITVWEDELFFPQETCVTFRKQFAIPKPDEPARENDGDIEGGATPAAPPTETTSDASSGLKQRILAAKRASESKSANLQKDNGSANSSNETTQTETVTAHPSHPAHRAMHLWDPRYDGTPINIPRLRPPPGGSGNGQMDEEMGDNDGDVEEENDETMEMSDEEFEGEGNGQSGEVDNAH